MRAIACSYERFHKAFRNTDSNFRECFIVENSDLIRGPADTGIINERFFSGNILALNMEMVSKIKFTDLLRRDNTLSLDEISANLGIYLSLATYLRLSGAILGYKQRCERKANDPASSSVSRFWSKKGGEAKKVRKVLDMEMFKKKTAEKFYGIQ
jgi:hypothetical protein